MTSVDDAYKALRWILDVPAQRRQVRDAAEFEFGFDFDQVVALALANKQRIRELQDQRAQLQERIEHLRPWGDFRLPDADALGGYRLWFYLVPLHLLQDVERGLTAFEEVHRDNRYSYLVVIAAEEPSTDLMPVPRVRTGSRSLHELQQALEHTELKIEDAEAEHHTLSRWAYLLRRNLARAEDRSALDQAEQQVWSDAGLCVVQGWTPRRDLPRLRAFAQAECLAMLVEDPSAADRPPTYMSNPPPLDGGEDLVSFYQTPGYRDWDPSRLVFFSFALFFAMILADAGYALLLGLGLAWAWTRLGDSRKHRRLRVLLATVLATSLVYGVLVGGYFGVTPPADSWLNALKVLNLDDFDTMMKLAIGIGCLHLAVANGVVAWRIGHFPAMARPLGWILVLAGGYLGYLGAETLGAGLLAVGLGLVVVGAGERPITDLRSAGLRVFDGLIALAGVSRMFGDILSYLRLFALGLASASLAMTFNDLAVQVRHALPGEGLLLAILILLIGHAINLALSVLSGFVHGLRLNFIEFFNWGLSDEGYPFRPFASKEAQSL